MKKLIGAVLALVLVGVSSQALAVSFFGGGRGVPSVGAEGDCLIVSGAAWVSTTCPSGAAGASYTVQAVTGNATLAGTHKFVTCDATLGAVAITLPAASATSGADFQIKKIDSSANACTITRAGTDTIDGATTAVLTVQYEALGVASDGTSAWTLF